MSGLLHLPITAFPDFSLPFHLHTDVYAVKLGTITVQVQEGCERNICRTSRTTTATERHHCATKLKYLAIVWALCTFQHYLIRVPIEVLMDHYMLQWLQSMKSETATCWWQELEEFDFVVKHHLRKSQSHVDALSCLPTVSLEGCTAIHLPD